MANKRALLLAELLAKGVEPASAVVQAGWPETMASMDVYAYLRKAKAVTEAHNLRVSGSSYVINDVDYVPDEVPMVSESPISEPVALELEPVVPVLAPVAPALEPEVVADPESDLDEDTNSGAEVEAVDDEPSAPINEPAPYKQSQKRRTTRTKGTSNS